MHDVWHRGKRVTDLPPSTSQFGESVLINWELSKIDDLGLCCFEVGAGDGKELSNSYPFRERGYRAALIECDLNKAAWAKRFANDFV